MTSKDPLEGDLTVRMPVSVMTAHLSIPALDPTVIKPRSEQHNIDAKIGGLEGVFRSWGKPQRRGRHAGRAEEEPPRSIVIPATLSKPTLTGNGSVYSAFSLIVLFNCFLFVCFFC